MTFHPMAQEAVMALPEGKHVCELGNQRFTGQGGHESTEAFYKSIGYEKYTALDVNNRMGALIADLNYSLMTQTPALMGKCDLVTNNGTGEHIFNQASVFENCHRLCRVGGIMLHILPLCPWVNHGFYNYNPILFRDIAAANGYDWRLFWISDRWGNRVELSPEEHDMAFKEKKPREMEDAISKVMASQGSDVSIAVAWMKMTNRAFKAPIQGKYTGDVESTALREAYALFNK